MDRKGSSLRSNQRKPRKGGKKKGNPMSLAWLKQPILDSFLLKTGLDLGAQSSGTSGTISSTVAPSFTTFTEYSAVSALFTEVKLVKCVLEIAPVNPYLLTAHWTTKIDVGWNPLFNHTTYTNPSSITEVINLSPHVVIPLGKAVLTNVPGMPKISLYGNIADVDPKVSVGDCGAWVIYGTGLTASTAYFTATLHAVYSFRGRH